MRRCRCPPCRCQDEEDEVEPVRATVFLSLLSFSLSSLSLFLSFSHSVVSSWRSMCRVVGERGSKSVMDLVRELDCRRLLFLLVFVTDVSRCGGCFGGVGLEGGLPYRGQGPVRRDHGGARVTRCRSKRPRDQGGARVTRCHSMERERESADRKHGGDPWQCRPPWELIRLGVVLPVL